VRPKSIGWLELMLDSQAAMNNFVLSELDPGAIPVERIPQVLAALAAWQSALVARLMAIPTSPEPAPQAEDRMLTVRECAERLRRSPKWVYRRTKTLPFARCLGPRSWVFSQKGLEKWLAQRRT
jgi:predicted DNA-binding transcriptional regulator AlpA